MQFINYDSNHPSVPVIVKNSAEKVSYLNIFLDIEETVKKEMYDKILLPNVLIIYKNHVDFAGLNLTQNSKEIYELKKALFEMHLFSGEVNSFADEELRTLVQRISEDYGLSEITDAEKSRMLDLIINYLVEKNTVGKRS